jgi:DNA-binding NarL/FixJ family response regulator
MPDYALQQLHHIRILGRGRMTWTLASATRIALLDDHAVVRYGLAKRLAEEPDFAVIGAFATSKELMAALRASPADLLLIDYSLGSNDIDGLNLIRALRCASRAARSW